MRRLLEMLDNLNGEFLHRSEVLRGLAIGLITCSNVLLVGPPGTAKSMLVHRMVKQIEGLNYFEYLMTKFTRPDELIGPISLKGLEKDELSRVLKGRLAEAHVAFLDEIFNSNSGCLNAILNIVNERRLVNGTEVVETPLIMLVGATNELPANLVGELSAFYDRFLLKYQVNYLDKTEELQALLSGDLMVGDSPLLNLNEIECMQSRLTKVKISEQITARIAAIVLELRRQGVIVSDRRAKQSCQALRAAALLAGREEVVVEDLWLLKDIYWQRPEDQEIFGEVWAFFQKPVVERVDAITLEADQLFRQLASSQWSLGSGTHTGARMLELKDELLGMLDLYAQDTQLAVAIERGMGRVDELVAKVFQNMFAGNGGHYLQ